MNKEKKIWAGIAIAGMAVSAILAIRSLTAKAASVSQPVQVQIQCNPITTILSIDGTEVQTPSTIVLSPGIHTFSAVPTSPDLLVTYGFDSWQINGVTVNYQSTAQINITGPCIITAQYMMIEATVNSPAALPNSEGLPNLINPNINLPSYAITEI